MLGAETCQVLFLPSPVIIHSDSYDTLTLVLIDINVRVVVPPKWLRVGVIF